jgi:hypothetical protein
LLPLYPTYTDAFAIFRIAVRQGAEFQPSRILSDDGGFFFVGQVAQLGRRLDILYVLGRAGGA